MKYDAVLLPCWLRATRIVVVIISVSILASCKLSDIGLFAPEPPPVIVPEPKPQLPSRPSITRLPQSVAAAISGEESTAFSAIHAINQLQLGQLDKFSPYYHRAQQYLLLELQIQQLIKELVVYVGVQPNALRYELLNLEVDLPRLPFKARGVHIVNELIQDQLALYLVAKEESPTQIDGMVDFQIKPKLTMKMGQICLQLQPIPNTLSSKPQQRKPSMAMPISDFYFYDYLDGIRQQ